MGLVRTNITIAQETLDLVDAVGVPWDARPGPLVPAREPGDGWYREYAE